jgi:WG containing repeat
MRRLLIGIFSLWFASGVAAQKSKFCCRLSCDDDMFCRYVLLDSSGGSVLPDTANYFKLWNENILVNHEKLWSILTSTGIKLVDSLDHVHWNHTAHRLGSSKNGKWGFYSADAKLVVPHIYDEASNFYYNVALVKKGAKYFYLDTNGRELSTMPTYIKSHFNQVGTHEIIIPSFEPDFSHDLYEEFPEEPYYAKKGIREISTDSIVANAYFDDIRRNNHDYAIVTYNSLDGVFCLSKRQMIIPCIYRKIYFLED